MNCIRRKIALYDANGNILTATDTEGTVTRDFDALNCVKKVIDTNGNVIQYTYDPTGNLTVIIYPDVKTITYSYGAANHLSTVTDWSGRITSYSYDANVNYTGYWRFRTRQ